MLAEAQQERDTATPASMWKGRCCDFLKLLPSAGWGLMCIVAIPGYASRGWYWPVFVAIISTAMCGAFAYEIVMYHRRFQYVLGGEYLLGWKEKQADLPKVKIGVAAGVLIVFLVLSQVFINTFDDYIRACNEKYTEDDARTVVDRTGFGVEVLDETWANTTADPRSGTPDCPADLRPAPCNGFCEDCPEDPDCSDWMGFMSEHVGMLSICSPINKDAETDTTFSCLADGMWMRVSSFIALLWLISVLFTARRARLAAKGELAAKEDDSDTL